MEWRRQRADEKKVSDDRSDKVYQYVIDQLKQQNDDLAKAIDRINAERAGERTEYNAKFVALNNDHLECVRSQAELKGQNELLIAEQLRLRTSYEQQGREVADLRVQVQRIWKHNEADKQNEKQLAEKVQTVEQRLAEKIEKDKESSK